MRFCAYASSSKANAYTLNDGRSTILIDMGLPIRELKKRLGFGLSRVSFALLSHCHNDHSRAVAGVMKAGVDVYASRGTIEALGLSGHRVHAVEAGRQFNAGNWRVMPLEAQHDAPEPLAFLIANIAGEKCLFATDTFYLKNRFVGLDIIAVECNYIRDILDENVSAGLVMPALRDRLIESHFSLENVKKFLEANDLSQVKGIWLLHMSDQNCDAGRAKREIQELTGIPTYIAQEVATCQ